MTAKLQAHDLLVQDKNDDQGDPDVNVLKVN